MVIHNKQYYFILIYITIIFYFFFLPLQKFYFLENVLLIGLSSKILFSNLCVFLYV